MIFLKRIKIKRLTKKIKVLKQYRLHNAPTPAAIKKEIDFYHQLAKIYLSLHGKKKFPFARELMCECYRASSTIEDAEGQYLLAKSLIAEGKCRMELQQDDVFSSEINEKRARQLFEEALAYLKTASEQLNHIQAKRLYGLCYINGWGVTVDQDKGFECIVASIDQENSWDKVPQIFASMGLNKPEFFAALMQTRKKG